MATLLAALAALVALAALAPAHALDHVRVTFGADGARGAVVSFASNASAADAAVSFAPAPFSGCGAGAAPGAVTLAAAGADNSYANAAGLQVVYAANLTGRLAPSTTYYYRACLGAGAEVSPQLSFTTLAEAGNAGGEQPVVCYWGDLGRDGGGQAWPALEAEAARTAAHAPGACSAGIQNGDFAYDLGDLDGARGAAFMTRFSGIAATLPTWQVPCTLAASAHHHALTLAQQ